VHTSSQNLGPENINHPDFFLDSAESPFASYSKRETFANNNDPSFRCGANLTLMKNSPNVSNSASEIKEHERILNIFNEGTKGEWERGKGLDEKIKQEKKEGTMYAAKIDLSSLKKCQTTKENHQLLTT